MKNCFKSLLSFAAALVFGAAALSAQSCAVVDHASRAGGHALAASGEVSGAVVESGVASGKAVAGTAAVPLWLSGTAVQGSGAVANAVGRAGTASGAAIAQGAEQLWDSASGDPARRPALDRTVGVPATPPAPAPAPAPHRDPSPAAALKATP